MEPYELDIPQALERLQNGTATPEEEVAVRRQIAAYEALTQYVYGSLDDADVLPQELDDTGAVTPGMAAGEVPEEGYDRQDVENLATRAKRKAANRTAPWAGAEQFTRLVNRTIRRAFVKAGAVVLAIVLVVVVFFQFAAPHLVNLLYYDPTKVLWVSENGAQTTQFDLDMQIYTELYYPNISTSATTANALGFGNYDFRFISSSAVRDDPDNRNAGRISRGDIWFYSGNVTPPYSSSTFDADRVDRMVPESEATFPSLFESTARERIEALDEVLVDRDAAVVPHYEEGYAVYIFFPEDKDFAEMMVLQREIGHGKWWFAPRTGVPGGEAAPPIGFRMVYMDIAISYYGYKPEEYPYLRVGVNDTPGPGGSSTNRFRNEAAATKHFTQMLQYMQEQRQFMQMMGKDTEELAKVEAYVAENGLQFLGAYVRATKEMLLKIDDMDVYYSIHVPGDAGITNYVIRQEDGSTYHEVRY